MSRPQTFCSGLAPERLWGNVRSLRSLSGVRRSLVPLGLVLLGALFLGSAPQSPQPRTGTIASLPGISDRAALLYAEAASALRIRDCEGAVKLLTPLTSGKGQDASFSRLLTGFYAHACEQPAQAEERLFAAIDPGGVLKDWRLYLLSDAAAAQGHVLLAQASLGKLIGDHPASPLQPPRPARRPRPSPGSGRTRSSPWS